MKIYIGNKTYSSWSLRGWLALKATGEPFEEVMIRLRESTTKETIANCSPSRKIPVLELNSSVKIHDTLAIGEYLAEMYPSAGLWPKDTIQRALARSICAEIHSGFPSLRSECPMDLKEEYPDHVTSEDTQKEVARIFEIWDTYLSDSKGPFLFGTYGLADMFFTPIVTRLTTYHIEIPQRFHSYVDAILTHPYMKEWTEEAQIELPPAV